MPPHTSGDEVVGVTLDVRLQFVMHFTFDPRPTKQTSHQRLQTKSSHITPLQEPLPSRWKWLRQSVSSNPARISVACDRLPSSCKTWPSVCSRFHPTPN